VAAEVHVRALGDRLAALQVEAGHQVGVVVRHHRGRTRVDGRVERLHQQHLLGVPGGHGLAVDGAAEEGRLEALDHLRRPVEVSEGWTADDGAPVLDQFRAHLPPARERRLDTRREDRLQVLRLTQVIDVGSAELS